MRATVLRPLLPRTGGCFGSLRPPAGGIQNGWCSKRGSILSIWCVSWVPTGQASCGLPLIPSSLPSRVVLENRCSFSISLPWTSALYHAGLFPNPVHAPPPPPLPPHPPGLLTLGETSVNPLRQKQIFLKGASWQSLSLHPVTSDDRPPSRNKSPPPLWVCW